MKTKYFSLPGALRRLWSTVPAGGSLPEEVWRKRHRFLLGLTWFHAVIIALLGPALGYSWELSFRAPLHDGTVLHAVAEGLIVALFALLASRKEFNRALRATLVGFGLISSSAILVHFSGGYIELHFHFFVMLVFMALYQDWVPYGLAVLYVAVHHGVVGVLWPTEVYNHPAAINAPWTWAGIHAFFVLWASVGSITAWRFNEKAFAQTKLILDSAGEGLCGLDREGKITFINQAAARMLSLDAGDVVGKPMDRILTHTKGNGTHFPAGSSPILAPLEDGAAHQAADEIFRRQDGTSFPVDYVSTPMIERGELTGLVVNFKDVTERKRAEAARRAAEARFAGILDIAADAIIAVDESQHIILFNKGAEQVFGYSTEEVLGRPLDLLLPPRFAEAHRRHIHGFAAASEPARRMSERREVFGRRRDGTEFPAEASISKLTQDGKTIFTVILRDITQRNQREEALRESEARQRAILESALDCVVTMDHEGKIVEFNPAAESTFGHARAEVIGKPMADMIIPPSLREKHRRGLAHYLATGEGPVLGKRIEMTAMRADGSEFPVEMSIAPIGVNGQPMFTGYLRDISERKQAEERTQRNLERLAALREIDKAITSTLDLRIVLDVLLEKIELVLPYAAVTIRLFNKESGLLEPVACRNLDEKEWKAEQWKGGRGTPNLAFESKTPVMVGNVQTDPRVRDPEFFRRHGLVSYLGVPLIVQNDALGVISFYTKEEHEFANEEIEFLTTLAGQAAIAIHNSEVYEELAKLAGDLSKANRVKDEFLSVMSHELRTPLNVVMGYSGMIRDGLLGEINPEQEKALEKVINRARDQLTMISSILQATQMEAEEIKVERHEFSLRDFLDDLKSSYSIPLGKELALVWDYPADLPAIHTDGEKLKHVLQNLINNAIKFTEKGSVTVSARYFNGAGAGEQDRAQGKGNNQEGFLQLKVSDTGVGIADEHLSVIFERFRQVDSSETRHYGGVGIGLYIAKQFTELLGGQIEVESEPGKGSTFTVTIPYEQRTQPKQQQLN